MNHRHARRVLAVAVPAALLLIAGCQRSEDMANRPSADQPPMADSGRSADRTTPPAPPQVMPPAPPSAASPGNSSGGAPAADPSTSPGGSASSGSDYGSSAGSTANGSDGKAGSGANAAADKAGDAAITAAVKARLLADPSLSAQEIEVTTKDGGHVTLAGHVKSEAARERAEQLARNARGVQEVDNQLVVGSA